MKDALCVEHLEKSYGAMQVLKGLSFSVCPGEIFALLGINGAGKTTALECIEGLRKPDGGRIQMQGTYGVQLQCSSIPHNMKAGEALSLFSRWQQRKSDPEVLAHLGVQPFLQTQYAGLSTGQKRRLHLALALLGDPDLLFLDEPTAGLDVEGRAAIHQEIRALRRRGKTVVLASHDMAEVEELCDKIAILKNGKIAFCGTPQELTESQKSLFLLKIRFSEQGHAISSVFPQSAQDGKGYYLFETENLEDTLSAVVAQCKARQITLRDVKVAHAGVEQRFLEIAKEDA